MHRLRSFALFVSAFLATASPCLAAVEVVFLHPEAYSDASLYNGYGAKGQEPALRGIREHLQRLGERYLKPGDSLKVEVLDIDLAGRFRVVAAVCLRRPHSSRYHLATDEASLRAR